MPTRYPTYVVELFCGHGTISRVWSVVLGGCPTVTLDINDSFSPTYCMDIHEWSQDHTDQVIAQHPGMRPVVFASPPCQVYSQMNTTGDTSEHALAAADRNVAKAKAIADALGAVVLVMENPATGKLRDRAVIDFAPHRYPVDYCQYGYLYKKSTVLFSTQELPGFASGCALTCPGRGACLSCVDGRHVMHYDMLSTEERSSIPQQLAACLGRSILQIVKADCAERTASSPATKRTRNVNNDIQCINNLRLRRDASQTTLEVRVDRRGREALDWIPVDQLPEELTHYNYDSAALRDRVLRHFRELHNK